MQPPRVLLSGLVQRLLPSRFLDDRDVDKPIRLGPYGEVFVKDTPPTRHSLTEEGSYYTCLHGQAIGTANAYVIQTSFLDTMPLLYVQNNEPAATGKTIFLDALKLLVDVVPASTTQVRWAAVIDNVFRTLTTNHVQAATPVLASYAGPSQLTTLPTINWQQSATASVYSGSSASSRQVDVGALGGIPVIGDSLEIDFGVTDGGASRTTTTAGKQSDNALPLLIPPQTCASIYLWFVSNATTGLSYEARLSFWAK